MTRKSGAKLKKQQEECIMLWKNELRFDAALRSLCKGADGDYQYDPIALTIVCY